MNNILSMFLNNKAYIPLNRELAKIIGNDSAILLGELSYWSSIYEESGKLDSDGYFYITGDKLLSQTNLSKYIQAKCIQFLELLLFIQTKTSGLPARKYFKVNYEVIQQTIQVCINNKINLLDMYEEQVQYAKDQLKELKTQENDEVNKVSLFSNFKKQVFKILETSFKNFRSKYNIYINNIINKKTNTSLSKDKSVLVFANPQGGCAKNTSSSSSNSKNNISKKDDGSADLESKEELKNIPRARTRNAPRASKSALISSDSNVEELSKTVTGTKKSVEEKKSSSLTKEEKEKIQLQSFLKAAKEILIEKFSITDNNKLQIIVNWFDSLWDKGVCSTKRGRFTTCLEELDKYMKKYSWDKLEELLKTCTANAYCKLEWGINKNKSNEIKHSAKYFDKKDDETVEEWQDRYFKGRKEVKEHFNELYITEEQR